MTSLNSIFFPSRSILSVTGDPTAISATRATNSSPSLNILAVQAKDNVIGMHACFLRRTTLLNVADDDAMTHAQRLHDFRRARPGIPGDADGAARDMPVPDNIVVNPNRHVHRQRKSDALRSAVLRGDHGVDPDHFAANVQQRPSAVSRINGRVGLNEALKL